MDCIHIRDLEIWAKHGVYPEENALGQKFVISADLYLYVRRAGLADELEFSVDYGAVCHRIKRIMEEHTCKLLEAVAGRLAEALLLQYRRLSAVTLEIVKPFAPVKLPFGEISVSVCRGWHRAYVALGSNMGDREGYLSGALEAMKHHPLMEVRKVSRLLVTRPYGGVEQEDFLNGVAEVETLMNPEQLLNALQTMEQAAGRERLVHWGPRTLDLDILFYDKIVVELEHLVIPHPDLENRRFVLEPLAEIAPYFRHPVTGKTAMSLLKELKS